MRQRHQAGVVSTPRERLTECDDDGLLVLVPDVLAEPGHQLLQVLLKTRDEHS